MSAFCPLSNSVQALDCGACDSAPQGRTICHCDGGASLNVGLAERFEMFFSQ
jgi:hypothetical protein